MGKLQQQYILLINTLFNYAIRGYHCSRSNRINFRRDFMIRSMTAFARQERSGDWGSLTLELRSVNHRYLEFNTRLPEELRPLEPKLREAVTQRVARGKIDCFVRYQLPEKLPGDLVLNSDLATKLAHASREVDALLYNSAPVNSLDVLKWPGVLQTPGPDSATLQGEAITLIDAALDELVENREREGEKLKAIILQRCRAMAEVVPLVRERLPKILEEFKQRLRDRLAELKGDMDEDRLEQEMALLAQKLDVHEEMDRLDTHIEEVQRVLEQDQPVGRRLDFLMQELNREANTLGSKSADTDTTRASMELKVLIEQMREQVQNIE
jgi:uncharacterized protein (TIGR00255 family)